MDLEKLKTLNAVAEDSEYKVSVEFSRLERDFTETDRNMVLYSRVIYKNDSFNWDAVIPTVKIPYKDPALGFMLGGLVFSSVGIYQRAPGVVFSKNSKDPGSLSDRVEIVSSRNSKLEIQYRRNGVTIGFRKRGKERRVPIGVFLKAVSGLPYEEILNRFAFKPAPLLNSFPCEVSLASVDMSKKEIYGIDSDKEPSIEDCVNAVYDAITQYDSRANQTNYSVHWKTNRILSYFAGLHFKSEQNYESTLSLHSRAIGTYLDQDLCVNIYDPDGSETTFSQPRGTFISEEVAAQLRWYDVSTLRVRVNRSYLIQEDSPLLFRACGYKLAADISELGLYEGTIIDREVLKKINGSSLRILEVFTPKGRKILSRSSLDPEVGDFITILNAMFTSSFKQQDEASQYEVANRVIIDYDKQVLLEVEQVYQDIVNSLAGCASLKNILQSLPPLPSTALENHLRDSRTRELSQAEITNIMSRAVAEKRASSLMKSAPAAMTAVQNGQYARIDSLHSPESDKVGSVQEMTAMARLDSETGVIEAPYEKVIDGVPTGEIEYISAAKEKNKYIAGWDEEFKDEMIMVRYNGDVTTVTRNRVNYRDVSPFCDMSVSRMTIPFPEFSQPRRSLMATKMSGQAVPLLFPERPRVSTGADTEIPCLYYTGKDIVESSLGADAIQHNDNLKLEIISVRWNKVAAIYTCVYNKRSFTFSVPFTATDKETLYNYNLNYKDDNIYELEDIVFYNQSCDIGEHEYFERIKQGTLPLIKDIGKPAMALGVNLRVVYKTYQSSTVDDAVVISDRLVKNRKLSSIQIFKYSYTLKPNEYLSPYNGTAALHSYVHEGQPVITVLKNNADAGREKHVYASQFGEVIFTESVVVDKVMTVNVWVATIHDAVIGDKVAGRYGNKSVIAKIIPESDMPYDPVTGESADIIVSPLSIPSRMNYGQLLEVTLGMVMDKQNRYAVVTPFYKGIKKEIQDLYNAEGFAPKKLYNPVYGKYTERPVMVGVMYFLKLEQMSNIKWSAVGYPTAVDPVFEQPVTSTNSSKGQSMEEMITWALAAAGANKILNNLFTLYSSDGASRKNYFTMLAANEDVGPGTWDETTADALQYKVANKDALVTQTVFRMAGQDLIVGGTNKYRVVPLNLDDINVIITLAQLKDYNENIDDNEWCKVKLAAPVINPFWVENFPLNAVLGIKSVKTLIKGTDCLNVHTREQMSVKAVADINKGAMITGIDAVIALLENTTLDQAIENIKKSVKKSSGEAPTPEDEVVGEVIDYDGDAPAEQVSAGVADLVSFINLLKESNMELKDLIWNYMPILPRVFRQRTVVKGVGSDHSFHKQLVHICTCSKSSDIYEAMRQLIGYGKPKSEDLISLRGYFFGKDSQSGQHGAVRGNVLSKRVGFSGRAVIVPSNDVTMSPYFVGLPWKMAMIELCSVLFIRLSKRASRMERELNQDIGIDIGSLESLTKAEWERLICSLAEYNSYVFDELFPKLNQSDKYYLFYYFRSEVKKICEGDVSPDGRVRVNGEWMLPEEVPDGVTIDAAVVQAGRQPTLHKKSIRCFFVKLVDGFSMVIHPLVCAGYNADFDGDTMWNVQLFGEMKNEGWRTISVLQDLISEKDGSYTLGIVQDAALGLYCATIFKDNATKFTGCMGDYHYFDSADALRMQLEYGDLNYYDAVLFRDVTTGAYYLSTAGRILINASITGALTKLPFSDKWGICEQTLGKEFIPHLCQLKYDCVLVATGIAPKGAPAGFKIEKVLLDAYDSYGARESINITQRLYEIGLTASDIYSVSYSMEDMSVNVDVEKYMKEPQEYVAQLNSLEQMGLVTTEEKKSSSIRAWERARKAAMDEVVAAIPENSNIHFMMYSGARGKPDQVMQSVGFIGTIAKTSQSDIEYPILRGYGSGLTSLDLAQTCYTARIGVVSTQTGTKETGYATRQTVYMSSGMFVKEEDCGIDWSTQKVVYDTEAAKVTYSNGKHGDIESLLGEFVDPSTEQFEILSAELNRSGYMINERVLGLITTHSITELRLLDKTATITYYLDEDWRDRVIEEGYSYALPFTDNRKITRKSLDWVEKFGLTDIILFDEAINTSETCFTNEAYLPVEYDNTQYSICNGDIRVVEEALYGRKVDSSSPKIHYYIKLLGSDGELTVKAMQYLTKKQIRSIVFEDGEEVSIIYKLSKLFRDLVVGRKSIGLPYLDADDSITEETLKEIENCQLEAIPVRTTLTCLTEDGVCKICRGKSLSTKQYPAVGENLGIAAAQAQCEPLSQATLNVTHSGGKRGSGTALVSGLDYYGSLLHGKLVTANNETMLERKAGLEGYVVYDKHSNSIIKLVDKDGNHLVSRDVGDLSRLAVPEGAYVDKDQIISLGITDLGKYDSSNIFHAALHTRYMLINEYYRIFKALNVSPRNYEILAREQTSICYLHADVKLPTLKDCSAEIKAPTGKYRLRVAKQSEVVNKYSGIAGFAFENVMSMIASGVFNTTGLPLNSALGNLVTGTPVGDTTARFIPRRYGRVNSVRGKSAVKALEDKIISTRRSGIATKELTQGPRQFIGGVQELKNSLLQDLLSINSELEEGIPGVEAIAASSEFTSANVSKMDMESEYTEVVETVIEEPVEVSSKPEQYRSSLYDAVDIDYAPVEEDYEDDEEDVQEPTEKTPGINRLSLD